MPEEAAAKSDACNSAAEPLQTTPSITEKLCHLERILQQLLTFDVSTCVEGEKAFEEFPRAMLHELLYSFYRLKADSDTARIALELLSRLLQDEWETIDWRPEECNLFCSGLLVAIRNEQDKHLMDRLAEVIGAAAKWRNGNWAELSSLVDRFAVSNDHHEQRTAILLLTHTKCEFNKSSVWFLIERLLLPDDDNNCRWGACSLLKILARDGDAEISDKLATLATPILESTESAIRNNSVNAIHDINFSIHQCPYLLKFEACRVAMLLAASSDFCSKRLRLKEFSTYMANKYVAERFRVISHCSIDSRAKYYNNLINLFMSLLNQAFSESQRDNAFKAIARVGGAVKTGRFKKDFVKVFKKYIVWNKEEFIIRDPSKLDRCLGCLDTPAEVIIRKLCDDDTCSSCACRAHWCTRCLSRHFLQSAERVDKTATCPTCRATFCVKDVLLVVADDTSKADDVDE